MRSLLILAFFSCIMVVSCKKKPHPQLSAEKEITSFGIKVSDSEYFEGIIRNDSILVQIPHSTHRDNLQAFIDFKGKSISPLAANVVDYTNPVIFTVRADDGSQRSYIVVVSNFTSVKEILSFSFKAADNDGIDADVAAAIDSNSISVVLPPGADITQLKPSITYKGVSISPGDKVVTDFTNEVKYTVTADDKSTRTYSVLVSYNNLVYIGWGNGNLYALSCVTGRVKWKYNTGYTLSHAIFKDGTVYVGSSDGTFYALDGTTGTLKWKFYDQQIFYTAPHVNNGVVYVGFYLPSPFKDGVYAINAQTGSLIWKRIISVGVGSGSVSGPTYSDGSVFVSEWNKGLYSLNAATGDIKWNDNVGITTSNPAVVNGTVYICSEKDKLSAFDAGTGLLKWTCQGAFNVFSSPTVLNGVVYAGGSGYMYAVDAGSGSLKWETKVTKVDVGTDGSTRTSNGAFSSPVVSGDLVFAGNNDCNTFAFDIITGIKKWSYDNNGGVTKNWQPGPVVAHGMLITDRGDNMLKAFYASTGKLIWTFTADGPVNTYPCIVDTGGNAFLLQALQVT